MLEDKVDYLYLVFFLPLAFIYLASFVFLMVLSSTLGLDIACKSYGGRVCGIISLGLLTDGF